MHCHQELSNELEEQEARVHQPIEDVDEHQRQLQDEVNQTDMLEQFHEGIDEQERTIETVFFP